MLDNIAFAKPGAIQKWSNLTGADWAGLANVVVGGAAGVIKSQNDYKSTQAQANAINNQSAANVEIAKINAISAQNLALAKASSAALPAKKMSTGVIAAIVIGSLAVVGGIIYVVVKKSN